MRLINTTTLELVEYHDPPRYAILSHRREAEEVSYKDYCLVRKDSQYTDAERADRPWLDERAAKAKEIRTGSGYEKIVELCCFAKCRMMDWVWIDMCCIDKRSSSELSESINSVKHNGRCSPYNALADFSRCGNALQELLAPMHLVFCAQDWLWINEVDRLCDGNDRTHPNKDFIEELSRITTIPAAVLARTSGLHDYSVATRMSWAAGRTTTREEDVAYSLLGLFNTTMPLVYGEGPMAFIRLQREIIAHSDDLSILACKIPCENDSCVTQPCPCASSSVLAPHPRYFVHCRNIADLSCQLGNNNVPKRAITDYTHEITNRGLSVNVEAALVCHVTVKDSRDDRYQDVYLLRLPRVRTVSRVGPQTHAFTMLVRCNIRNSRQAGPLQATRRLLVCDLGMRHPIWARTHRLESHNIWIDEKYLKRKVVWKREQVYLPLV